MSLHEHDWRHVRHVLRCADADCGAWTPAPLSAAAQSVAPIEPSARRRKPTPAAAAAKRTKPAAPAAAAGSNVVPLSSRRKG